MWERYLLPNLLCKDARMGNGMKIDRLIGILSVMLQREKVTAPELAEMFEVSRRTINRDIEDLCKAGIPIVTRQGANGGISIIDGWLRRNVNGIKMWYFVWEM